MEISTNDAARELQVSQRQVQRLAAEGRIASRAVAGRVVVGGRSLLAATRMAGRGRRWDDETVVAALELLESGSTARLQGRKLARLQARLAEMTVSELAYQALASRVSFWRKASGSATAAGRDGFTSSGSTLEVLLATDVAFIARTNRLVEDLDGDVLIVDFNTSHSQLVLDLTDYAYGDVRMSAVARQRLEEKLREAS